MGGYSGSIVLFINSCVNYHNKIKLNMEKKEEERTAFEELALDQFKRQRK